MSLGKTAAVMTAGGIAYAVIANIIHGMLRDFPMDGDSKLAFFFIGMFLTGLAVKRYEDSLYF